MDPVTAGTGMLVTAADIDAFARASGDFSPLHVDASYARKTPFGEPVAHGVLCLLRLIATGPARPGLRLSRLNVRFTGPVLRDQSYTCEVVDTPRTGDGRAATARLLDGPRTLLEAQVEYAPGELRTAPSGAADPGPAGEAADMPLQQLAVGARFGQGYRPDWQALQELLDGLGPRDLGIDVEHAAVLAWASRLAGMEAPGRSALLSSVELSCEPAGASDGFSASAEVTDVDPRFRTVLMDGTAVAGSLSAQVVIRAFARRHAQAPSMDRVRELLGSQADGQPLAGRVAFVAGGSRGLGAALVQALALAGCTVHVGFRDSATEARDLVANSGSYGRLIRLEQGDVSDPAWCAQTREGILAEHGRCDLLVLNASPPALTLGLDAASAERASSHVQAALALAQAPLTAFAADVAEAGGTVVAVSSSYVRHPPRGLAHYVCAKYALEGLAAACAAEHPSLRVLVARPPRLATTFADSVTGAETALDVASAAVTMVGRLITGSEPGRVDELDDFPPVPQLPVDGNADQPSAEPDRGELVVAGTFTLDPLRPVLERWTEKLGLALDLRFSGYNQVFQELLDPASSFARNRHGCNAVLVRLEDWPTGDEGRRTAGEFAAAAANSARNAGVPLIVVVCPASPAAVQERGPELAAREDQLCTALADAAGVHFMGGDAWRDAYRIDQPHDPARQELAHVPYTSAAYTALGTAVIRMVHSLLTPPFKMLVLDCDNTLWQGVCGEDGPDGVVLTAGHRRLQEWAVEQQRRGVLLCLSSKNGEADVEEVFRRRPEMPLRPEHLAARRVDWNPKPANIAALAAELDLGTDSVVFLDDNPVEIAAVRSALPEVLALAIPDDEAEIPAFLDRLWAFDRPTVTEEDRARTAMYRAGREREKLRDAAGTFADFIAGLGLRVDVREAAAGDLARVAQLTQRTNQFNLSTIRRSEPELRALLDRGARCWVAQASDRFGDYGLVGAAITRERAKTLILDTFLMSCRVLGRGVEHAFLAKLGRAGTGSGLSALEARYAPTAKNGPAHAFFDSVLTEKTEQTAEGGAVYRAPLEAVARIAFSPDTGAGPTDDRALGGPVRPTAMADPVRLPALAALTTEAADGDALHRWLFEHQSAEPTVDVSADRPTVWDAVTDVLGGLRSIPRHTLRPETTLESLRLESLEIVDATVALEAHFGRLPTTLFFEHRTLGALADAVAEARGATTGEAKRPSHSPPHTPPSPPAPQVREEAVPHTDAGVSDIAVVGVAGRYPGAPDIAHLWQNLLAGTDSVGDAAERWGPASYVDPAGGPDKTYSSAAGLIDGVAEFDSLFFAIAPSEAETMDPQQRLFLQTAHHALEDAGHTAASLGRDVGVYVASMGPDYALLSAQAALRGESRYPNTDPYQLANRVSYFFDFTGPSLTVDTACSGSGVALQLACDAIRGGTVSAAIAGGVNLILHPARRIQYAQLGMVSPSGRCRPFGADADGMVTSEGVGAVVLRPLRDALADGDQVYGVIKAVGTNSDGRTNGFTVPSPEAQAALISSTLSRAGTPPASIGYVEAHGTGTPLGDPIEIRGLTKAFGAGSGPGSTPVGSVKSNLGHLEAAAAVVGLTKVLLQLRHRTLVPSLHAERLNPRIDFDSTPFRVQRAREEWAPSSGQPLRAALSSFGAGGVNVHLVVEEAPAELFSGSAPASGRPELVLLSAPDDEQLLAVCARLAEHLRGLGAAQMLADIAYTLRAGRTAFDSRIALVAADHGRLAEDLERIARGGVSALGPGTAGYGRAGQSGALSGVFDGSAPMAALLAELAAQGETARLGALWAQGARIDWDLVLPRSGHRRVSLPGYPFRTPAHWLPAPSTTMLEPAPPPRSAAVTYYSPDWVPTDRPAGRFPESTVVVLGGPASWAATAHRHVRDAADLATAPTPDRPLVIIDRRALDGTVARPGPAVLDAAVASARLALAGCQVTYVRLCRPSAEDPGSAAVTGFGRALSHETAGFRTLRMEITERTEPELNDVLAEACSGAWEVKLDGRVRTVLRWSPLDAPEGAGRFRTRGHYLISGGGGAVGRVLAARLATAYRASVVLIGRSEASAAVRELCERAWPGGGRVSYVRADVTDTDQVDAAVAGARDLNGPLHGVVHAAGLVRDGAFRDKSDEDMAQVLAPKLAGTLALDEATAADELDFFLVMSSYVGTLGNAGQADYCAGNRFLDAFVDQREARRAAGKRRGVSVSAAWPLWRDGGMSMSPAVQRLTETTLGLSAIGAEDALTAVEDILRLGGGTVLVGHGDAERIGAALARLEPGASTTADREGERGPGPEELRERLRAEAAALVKVDVERIDPGAEFGDYGFNSLLFTDFANRLNEIFGLALTPVTFFENPTIEALAEALYGMDVGDLRLGIDRTEIEDPAAVEDEVCASAEAAERPASFDSIPIAVIGMAGRFPGAPDTEIYWKNLLAGRDLVGPAPEGRFGSERPSGGFLDDILAFDAGFFGISPREARLMDPQQRLFLETGWTAIEDAGYDPRGLAGSATGVFVGATLSDYSELLARSGEEIAGHTITGHVQSIIANRLSYLLDLTGPSEVMDTACSSSLTALHRALRALAAGECAMAVAGGVNALFAPGWFASLGKAGMLSDSGRCWTFDARADGFVRGEGVGAVVLKPLDSALRDGDTVRAVIRGSAVNHGGRAHSLTAPNPRAQAAVVAGALRNAGVAPGTVTYIETHGTGTKLGDPIEVAGLRQAFEQLGAERTKRPWCALGAVKSSIGHLESAAGMAGLIKVLLAIRYRTLPPNAAGDEANEHLELDGGPFSLHTARRTWEPCDPQGRPLPLTAGVSAFGFGGSNAHVVVEEPPTQQVTQTRNPDEPTVVVLSATGPERLTEYARRLRAAVADTSIPFTDLAYTTRVGRPPLPERLAAVVSGPQELLAVLDAYLSGGTAPGLFTGRAERERNDTGVRAPRVRVTDTNPYEVARRWVTGAGGAWPTERGRRRVPLPTYPFDHATAHGPGTERPAPAPQEDLAHTPSLFARHWRPSALPAGARVAGRPRCLLLVGAEAGPGAVETLAGLDEVDWVVLREPTAFPALVSREYELDFGDHQEGRRTAEELLRDHGPFDTVVDLLDVGGGKALGREAGRVGLLQVLVRHSLTGGLRLVHLTRGVVSVPSPTDPVVPAVTGARMASLVRSLGAEYAAVQAVTIDTDTPAEDLGALLTLALSESAAHTSQVCYREGVRYQPALVPVDAAPVEGGDSLGGFRVEPDRAYLVTGGTGGLGLAAAELLVRRGARRLVLTGLRPLPPRDQWDTAAGGAWWRERIEAVRRMETAGAEVLLHSGPLSDAESLRSCLARVRSRFGMIAGVLHCAGSAAAPSPFVQKSIQEIERIWEPKGSGLLTLDAALEEAGEEPDFVVLYSSASASVPALATGLTDYAAGNAVLDAYVAMAARRAGRRGSRTRWLSLGWGSWTGLGMGEVTSPRYRDLGLGALTRDQGLALLERALATPGHTELVALAARPGAEDALTENGGRAPLAETPAAAAMRPNNPEPAAGGLVEQCAGYLTEVLAEALMLAPDAITPEAPFADLGVDSILIVGIVGKLEAVTGTPLEPSVVLEYPSVARLAAQLAERHPDGVARWAAARTPVPSPASEPAGTSTGQDRAAESPQPVPAMAAASRSAPKAMPLAVIGMAGRFPGADDTEAFWTLLREGRSGVREVPRSRWDVATLYSPRLQDGRSISKWGGFLEGIEDFDPEYFGIPEADAAHVDPLTRLFLECAEQTFADAGYRGEELSGRRVGVFVGSGTSTYGSRIAVPGRATATGLNQNFIAAHLAHFRDLRGPNLVTDTACSSSLTALYLAHQSLQLGECDTALVGGADLILDETPYLSLSAGRALSPDGACHVFDAEANGFVPGEGVGAVLLKPLNRAIADGDRVLAVIEATAMNNDGRTMGLTTPNPEAQQAVISDALHKAGADAGTVSYVEAHGTGTMIGDPIELKALTRVFEEYTSERGFCAVGSVKSNVGHLLMAAGMAGLQKVVLSLVHQALPPTLHCSRPNPRFSFDASPFWPNTQLRPWRPRQGLRRAGLSAFGFGGTNCHVLVRELTAAERGDYVPRREPLPPPVFHRRRHWVERPGARPTVPTPHPLLELEDLT